MWKKLLSFVFAGLLFLTLALSACGKSEPEFDPSVFEGNDSLVMIYDEVSGNTTVFSAGNDDPNNWFVYSRANGQIWESVGAFEEDLLSEDREYLKSAVDKQDYFIIGIMPCVAWDESTRMYSLLVTVASTDTWPQLYKLIVKVGQKSYVFSDCKMTDGAGSTQESFAIVLNEDVVPFMDDLMEHQDEEINVRITAGVGDMEFALSDKQKADIINLYQLFDQAGGVNQADMERAMEMTKEEMGKYYDQKVEVRELY